MKKFLVVLLAGIMTMSTMLGYSSETISEENVKGTNNPKNDVVDENDGAIGALTTGMVTDTVDVNDRSFNGIT